MLKLKNIFISFCFVCSGAGNAVAAEVINTTNEKSKWNAQYYQRTYTAIQRTVDGLVFINEQRNNEIHLKIGEFRNYPGDHGHRKVTLIGTDEAGATFSYESSFDHTSFGRILIEKDEGEFFLKWKNINDQVQATENQPVK